MRPPYYVPADRGSVPSQHCVNESFSISVGWLIFAGVDNRVIGVCGTSSKIAVLGIGRSTGAHSVLYVDPYATLKSSP